jgi:hypothetical protein
MAIVPNPQSQENIPGQAVTPLVALNAVCLTHLPVVHVAALFGYFVRSIHIYRGHINPTTHKPLIRTRPFNILTVMCGVMHDYGIKDSAPYYEAVVQIIFPQVKGCPSRPKCYLRFIS